MTHVLFFCALLVQPLIGIWTWRLEAVRRIDLAGRLAVASAAGAVTTALTMSLYSLLHIPWSRLTLFPIFAATSAAGLSLARGALRPARSVPWQGRPALAVAGFLALTAYGILTARESAGDLHFFWGPKAIHFALQQKISVPYLANAINPNPDYPPLLPLLYAWATIAAGGFSWWSALLSSLLSLAGCVALMRAFTADDAGSLFAAGVFSWGFATAFMCGGADPVLVFFEMLVLVALVFASPARDANILAAIGLAGAAFTKIEGTSFVIAVILGLIVVRREFRRAWIALPAIAVAGAWFAFAAIAHLGGRAGAAQLALSLPSLQNVVIWTSRSASYGIWWLPWIVPLAFIRNPRRAAFPLTIALLTIAATIFYYLHSSDPEWWIAASAQRVLLTPLAAVLVAGLRDRPASPTPFSSQTGV